MNVYQPEMCLVINLKRSVSGTLTESIVQSVAVEVGSQRADAGRLKVLHVHTELSMGWVDPWVGLGWIHYRKNTKNLKRLC